MSVNLENSTVGELHVIGKVAFSFGTPLWECMCSCGRTCAVSEKKLLNKSQTTCGECAEKDKKKLIDLTGQRFGSLVVNREISGRNKQRRWLCQCDCGQVIIVYQSQLRNGRKESCGHDSGYTRKKDSENLVLKISDNSSNTTPPASTITLLEPSLKLLVEEDIAVYNQQETEKEPVNLRGKRFGKLLVIRHDSTSHGGEPLWYCICACGKGCYFTEKELLVDGVQSCGECEQEDREDLIGRRFGESVVLAKGRTGEETDNEYWKARCDCGKEFEVDETTLRIARRVHCGDNHSRYLDKNLIGQKFGQYTVTEPSIGNYRQPHWNIRCNTCGATGEGFTRNRLVDGKVDICDC